MVAPLCQQAMDLNFDGLIVESHCNPDCAWSDASQQVTPDVLDYILNLLVIRTETQSTESLAQLRKQIDECDDNIIQELAKRMRVAREIGTYKRSTESQFFKPDVTMRFWKTWRAGRTMRYGQRVYEEDFRSHPRRISSSTDGNY